MKQMKKLAVWTLTAVLAAGTFASAVPAQAANYYYRTATHKSEDWNTKTGSWDLQSEYKYTYTKNGSTATYYYRYRSYDSESQKYIWRVSPANKYVYNSNGSIKQINHYSDIKFKNYTGKSVYAYVKKGNARYNSKITDYDAAGKVTEITTYTRNTKGQTTKYTVTDKNKVKLRQTTYKYNSQGNQTYYRSESYENGKVTSWSTRTSTYKNGTLTKEVYKSSGGTTETTTYKNGLRQKSVYDYSYSKSTTTYKYNSKRQLTKETEVSVPKGGGNKTTWVYTYSGYDKHNHYTKRHEVYTSDSYSHTTDYKYTYKYSGDYVTQELVQMKDENTGKYVNRNRYSTTYKKFKIN